MDVVAVVIVVVVEVTAVAVVTVVVFVVVVAFEAAPVVVPVGTSLVDFSFTIKMLKSFVAFPLYLLPGKG